MLGRTAAKRHGLSLARSYSTANNVSQRTVQRYPKIIITNYAEDFLIKHAK